MNLNDRKEENELAAMGLIDQAENLIDKGKGIEAINLYEKAAQIYLDEGSYMKIDELFIRIADIISQFKNNIQAVYRLKSIVRKTEELKLYEISAKMLIQLGNIAYKMRDWETAGESWEKASDYLYEEDPEEFYNLSSVLLLKAGQAFEASPTKRDYGKNLILKAVMKINEIDEAYEIEEKKALSLIEMGEFEASAKKFLDIADNFREALKNLDEILEDIDSESIKINAKARFIHFVAEYQTVAALCLRASEERDFNQQIKDLADNSMELFKRSIALLKEYLKSEKGDYETEILLRITFDTMLLSILQGMLGKNVIKSSEYLLEGIDNKKLKKALKGTPYFAIVTRIEKVGIRETLDKLLNVNLGHFEKIKNTLISYFT